MFLALKYPVIQAPMAGGFTPVSLVAAVSNAGAIGSLGGAFTPPEDLRKAVRDIRLKTSAPFNVNLFAEKYAKGPFNLELFTKHVKQCTHAFPVEMGPLKEAPNYHEQIQVLLEEKVPVFSFTFGLLEKELVREMRKYKMFVLGTATHLEEVLALEELGVDAIICQGKEAGGHRGTFIGDPQKALIPTFDFLKQAHLKTKLPLIAAGGIMVKADVQKAFKEGASAVQMGTAFLTCNESGTGPLHRKALLEWHDRKAVLTLAFSGKWARGIENRFIHEMAPFERDVPPFPVPVFLLAPMRNAATERGDGEFLSLWAGEHFAKCKKTSVDQLLHSLFA